VLLEIIVRIVEVFFTIVAGIVVQVAVMGSTRVVLCEVIEAVELLRQDLVVQGCVTIVGVYRVLVM
jgi:hypothetical protein